MRQRVDAALAADTGAARTKAGEHARPVTGARNEPGLAVLARELPNRP